MKRAYGAVIRGDRVYWTGAVPTLGQTANVSVIVDEAEEPRDAAERRRRAVEALESIAAAGGIASIPDPIAWQREMREDRVLPGREG